MNIISLPIVLDAAAKASVILAIAALAAVALRRASASARHLVWSLGLLSALAVPALSVALPRWELPIVRVAATSTTEWLPPSGGSEPAIKRSVNLASPNLPPEGGSHSDRVVAPSVETPAARAPLSWTSIAFFVW